jgi:hypothetical protein
VRIGVLRLITIVAVLATLALAIAMWLSPIVL